MSHGERLAIGGTALALALALGWLTVRLQHDAPLSEAAADAYCKQLHYDRQANRGAACAVQLGVDAGGRPYHHSVDIREAADYDVAAFKQEFTPARRRRIDP